ncbi:MAG: biotin/lipoyl-binding protein [Bacteroidales bacterium]|nr:biotin/lipoyl-binding protein [Bacteroidales bacterium]
MKNYKFTINGNEYEVEMKNFEDNVANIEVNGTVYDVEVHREIKTPKTPTLVRPMVPSKRTDSKIKKTISSASSIKAPLPGNILSVLVKEGQEVKKGEKLLVYEAMKMENDVLAEKDGTVGSIKVSVGDSVLQGDTLMDMQ